MVLYVFQEPPRGRIRRPGSDALGGLR